MKKQKEIERELLLKEQRVAYWEKFGLVLDMTDLAQFNEMNEELRI